MVNDDLPSFFTLILRYTDKDNTQSWDNHFNDNR